MFKYFSFKKDEINPKSFKFSDGCTIKLFTDKKIQLSENGKTYELKVDEKPAANNGRGEQVYESQWSDRKETEPMSWAIAVFTENGISTAHKHKERTETYYIIEGTANVYINEKVHTLKTGESITIPKTSEHQVQNASNTQNMALVVKSDPAWSFLDQHPLEKDLAPSLKPSLKL